MFYTLIQIEVDKFKIQVNALTEENRILRQASVNLQARAEQEEEFISNTLLKKIQDLKKEKVKHIINLTSLTPFIRKPWLFITKRKKNL